MTKLAWLAIHLRKLRRLIGAFRPRGFLKIGLTTWTEEGRRAVLGNGRIRQSGSALAYSPVAQYSRLRILQKVLGKENPGTANSLENLGRIDEATALARIEALEGEIEKTESQLAQHVAGLGQARHALGVSVEQVQSAIPNDGALIEYLRYPHYLGKGKLEQRYGAIVLFSKGAPLWIPLGKPNEIENLVRRYGTLVRGSPEEDELSATLQALYEALWLPIGQVLPSQTKRVIISPDGELNFISFATLLTEDNQFLAEKYDLQYVASGRDLLRQVKPSTAREVVLFANPDFRLTSTAMLAEADNRSADVGSVRGNERGDIDDWSFGSLEGTQKERDELIKKFTGWGWTPSDFTAKEATKEALLKIHSPFILHLATHGFFAKEDPTSANTEAESSSKAGQTVVKSKFFKNPMHRSGLALAGAQTTIEALSCRSFKAKA